MNRFVPPFLAFLCCVGHLGCSETTPPASPRSDVRDVRVHRAEDKPDFIRLEREGDPTPALAVAYLHGANATTSRTLGKYLSEQLHRHGLQPTVVPTEAAVLVSLPVADATLGKNLVSTLRTALQIAQRAATSKPEVLPAGPQACGSAAFAATSTAPGHRNTVFAAVGSSADLATIQAAYEADSAWPDVGEPLARLPARDEFTTSASPAPAELLVALRTPLRQRVVPAARDTGAPNSMLSLLAESHDGHWKLRSSHAGFIPAGGCISVHLESQQPVDELHAARAAKAVLRELRWVLEEQTPDEDPRFNVLEAPNAEEAARRAAWEAVTRHGFTPNAPATAFVHYRGRANAQTWQSLLTAESTRVELPVVSRDERGQGRVWAALDNPCPLPSEDSATAGHTTAALLAASRAVPRSHLDVFSSSDHHGLVGWQPTQGPGAEDRLAEALARGVLETLRTPGLSTQLVRESDSALDTAPWVLALTLATNGHPSWLSQRSTPQSRALFDGGALQTAMRRFVSGPLQLRVLTNHGAEQAARLAGRLSHLLSGVHTDAPPCPAIDLGAAPTPAGEYEVGTPDVGRSVALYVVDRRFADSVRQLAAGLNQPNGWLRQAVEPLGARVTAIGLGSPKTMAALGFTISADTREAMDAAMSQLRVLVSDLAKAPLASLTASLLPTTSSPVERLATLTFDAVDTSAKGSSVSALVAEGLTERRLFIVRPVALPKALDSSRAK